VPLINAWWQQVSGTAIQGLQITIIGMSLVFLTLGLIILVLALLTRLPGLRARNKGQEPKTGPEAKSPSEPPTERADAADIQLAQVAAIAVALVRAGGTLGPMRADRVHLRQPFARGGSDKAYPPGAEGSVSRWKQYGRAHQLGL
jgi:Na+-transporting methylmalonyl-CoA/oxaloacetate decarboxylase gamma subunit